ncbi:O-antigen ligase family protein [Flavobacterium aciduliphilum]|nr:O-antigen ligase family protein [Flavobacterium aciduliphilum]
MTLSEKIYQKVFNLFLFIIPISIIFRKPATWLILLFTLFSLLNYRRINLKREYVFNILLVASPLLLEILFFWNNDSFTLGTKSLEKYLSLLVFPLFFIGNYEKINFHKLLKIYSISTTIIVLFFFFRFIIVYPNYFNKYLNGIHLWEMGYVFSKTIGMHAPALNMHIAFVTMINFFFFLNKENIFQKILFFLIFLISIFLMLFINTRVAIVDSGIGCLIIVFCQIFQRKITTKIVMATLISILSISIVSILFIKKDTYLKEKFTNIAFAHIDKIGKLDEIDHPEIAVYSSLVTRLSIWKSALELSWENLPFGVGSSDGKRELVKYFKKTNQRFLAKYEFATHNQYIDYLLKFGFLGLLVAVCYIFSFLRLGILVRDPLITSFFFLFFTSNMTDDFLIRFDGIVFSGFWLTIFVCYYLKKNQ